MTRHETHTLIK